MAACCGHRCRRPRHSPLAVASPRRTRKSCPDCTQTLVRVRRQPADRLLSDPATGAAMGRYRCANLVCGWQGLLPRERRPQAVQPSVRERLSQHVSTLKLPWGRVGSLMLVTALLVLVGVQGARQLLGAPPVRMAQALPVGEHHEGDPLPPTHPWLRPVVLAAADAASAAGAAVAPGPAGAASDTAVDPLDMRRGCAWGTPGRNPYRGTVEQALLHARLPPEVVQEVSRKVRAHEVADRLEIRTGRIHGVQKGREFDPQRVALSFGKSLCLNSRVNFPLGHVEQADLYEATDKRGHRHAVMVPDVCGNVSVLGERGERRRALTAGGGAGGGAGRDDEWWTLATLAAMSDGGTVPEPGTLVAALTGLLALGLVTVRQRRQTMAARTSPDDRARDGTA